MKYGLGIDTGGTYTDAVIYQFETNQIVCAAKSMTTKEDLSQGILGALSQLDPQLLHQVELVSLSTTLATNACVEGRGGRAQLIFIGGYPSVVRETGESYGLPPADEICFVEGGLSGDADKTTTPDWDSMMQQASAVAQSTDAFAVVEYRGMQDPSNEREAKRRLAKFSGKTVICGHELFSDLNYIKRGASTLLNARLVPVIEEFLRAITVSLQRLGIQAPVVIVRSDGTLMSQGMTREKPVETLLCGPAASVVGGIKLTGEKDCLVVDMGGTTTDIAIVEDGVPQKAENGVNVGSWRTFVKSVYIDTFGLGGDSRVWLDKNGEICLGPVRVLPISIAAMRYPQVKDKLRALWEEGKLSSFPLHEFFLSLKDVSEDSFYTDVERRVSRALNGRVLNLYDLCEATDTSPYSLNLTRLEEHGAILRCGLTPTDAMHIKGDFDQFDTEAARLCAQVLARRMDLSVEQLCEQIYQGVKKTMYRNLVRVMLERSDKYYEKNGVDEGLMHLIDAQFDRFIAGDTQPGAFACRVETKFSLVGIGAPIHVFLPDVAKALAVRCVVPENAGVANAVGAVVSNVVAAHTVTIRPNYESMAIEGYTVVTPDGGVVMEDYEEALAVAEDAARRAACDEAVRRGAVGEVSIRVESQEHNGTVMDTQTAVRGSILLETTVTATAVGKITL